MEKSDPCSAWKDLCPLVPQISQPFFRTRWLVVANGNHYVGYFIKNLLTDPSLFVIDPLAPLPLPPPEGFL